MKRPILFFWFILFFLYSCQSKKGDSSFLPLTELQPLTLGMMPTLDGLPFHIAKTQGIYDSLGLDLTILSFNSANDRDAAFQTRKIQISKSRSQKQGAAKQTYTRQIQQVCRVFCILGNL